MREGGRGLRYHAPEVVAVQSESSRSKDTLGCHDIVQEVGLHLLVPHHAEDHVAHVRNRADEDARKRADWHRGVEVVREELVEHGVATVLDGHNACILEGAVRHDEPTIILLAPLADHSADDRQAIRLFLLKDVVDDVRRREVTHDQIVTRRLEGVADITRGVERVDVDEGVNNEDTVAVEIGPAVAVVRADGERRAVADVLDTAQLVHRVLRNVFEHVLSEHACDLKGCQSSLTERLARGSVPPLPDAKLALGVGENLLRPIALLCQGGFGDGLVVVGLVLFQEPRHGLGECRLRELQHYGVVQLAGSLREVVVHVEFADLHDCAKLLELVVITVHVLLRAARERHEHGKDGLTHWEGGVLHSDLEHELRVEALISRHDDLVVLSTTSCWCLDHQLELHVPLPAHRCFIRVKGNCPGKGFFVLGRWAKGQIHGHPGGRDLPDLDSAQPEFAAEFRRTRGPGGDDSACHVLEDVAFAVEHTFTVLVVQVVELGELIGDKRRQSDSRLFVGHHVVRTLDALTRGDQLLRQPVLRFSRSCDNLCVGLRLVARRRLA